jgi:hypothetical protein
VAVVTYQCTVCKRQNNLVQFQQGLDWIGHCNITLGCRGTLYQIEVHPDYVRGQLPASVIGLKNWVQRKVLFNFTQTIPRGTWTITHDLGTLPAVEVYINQPTQTNPTNQIELSPDNYIINYQTDDQLSVTFTGGNTYSGIAQCIARSSNPDLLSPRPQPPTTTTVQTIQLSNEGILTIATRISSVGSAEQVTLDLQYTGSTENVTTDITYATTNVPSDLSPWFDTNIVVLKGKTYTVRTFEIQTGQTASGQVANGSYAQLVDFNSTGQISLPLLNSTPWITQTFVVSGDYTLYFISNVRFNTNVINGGSVTSEPWITSESTYNPATNETTITVTNTITQITNLELSNLQVIQNGNRQIAIGEVIILLGNAPFTIYDKVTDAYVDFASVTATLNPFALFIDGGDLFASPVIEQTIYPPIRAIT